jgi:hypothetical protein
MNKKASAAVQPYAAPEWAQKAGLKVVPTQFVSLTASTGPTRLHRWHLPSVGASPPHRFIFLIHFILIG